MLTPGVRFVISTVILARTGSPVTRSEFASKATLPFKLTDMKAVPVLRKLEVLASAVRTTISLPEAGTTAVTRGPLVSVTYTD
jgi:hypothetical protein